MAVENETTEGPQVNPLTGTGEDVTPNKDGGVLKAIKEVGDTTEVDCPMKGDTVSVHYVGTLTNGEEFDSSRRRSEKFTFKLGQGQVIKAWDLGVATMRRGEVSVLTCRSEYAYGKKGQGKIPPDATLVFEVELFDWTGEDLSEGTDGGIIRRIIKVGSGHEKPVANSSVVAHIVGKFGDRVFEDRDVSFILGEGSEINIPEGIETVLLQMESGELSEVNLKPKYGFGAEGQEQLNIPADATLNYQVQLDSFVKAREIWEMDAPERLTGAETAKAKGTEHYKAGRYKAATKQYKKIVDYLDYDSTCTDEEKKSFGELLLIGHLNLAMAYIKVQEYAQSVESCDKALEIDANNIKGLFRRAQAELAMSDLPQAKKDFSRVVELDPNNKAARNQLTIVLHKIKQANDREKKIYSNMFAKFAEQDRKVEESQQVLRPPMEFGGTFDKEKMEASSDEAAPMEEPADSSETKTESDEPSNGGGATTLDEGATTLDEGATTLDEGATTLDEGATTLDEGATTLDEGMEVEV